MKLKTLFLTLFLLVGISAFAIPKGPCDPKPECCEQPDDHYAFLYPYDNGLACPRGFNVTGEFLWMKAIEDNLDFTANFPTPPASVPISQDVTLIGFSSEGRQWAWRPGFRVGFGYDHSFDSWAMDGTWTYIKIKDKAEAVNRNNQLAATWQWFSGVTTNPMVSRARARWSGDYNTFDINIGKPIHFSRYFIFNPFFGARAAWIDQDYQAKYNDDDGHLMTFFFKNDFTGLGPRIGFDGKYLLPSNWSFFGKISSSLLFGKFDLSATGNDNFVPGNAWNYEFDFYNQRSNLELILGINFSKYFNKQQYKVNFNLAYNATYWWGMNHIRTLADYLLTKSQPYGDLYFNGLSAGFNIEF